MTKIQGAHHQSMELTFQVLLGRKLRLAHSQDMYEASAIINVRDDMKGVWTARIGRASTRPLEHCLT